MSWVDVKRRYEEGRTATDQSTEDMAARRILRAMGLTEKTMAAMEKATGTASEIRPDTTLLERAERLVRELDGKTLRLYPGRLPPVRSVSSPKAAEDIVLELAEQAGGQAGRPARAELVYRVRGADRLMAVTRLGSLLVDTDNLPLPCSLTRSRDGTAVLLWCEADLLYRHLIRPEGQNG